MPNKCVDRKVTGLSHVVSEAIGYLSISDDSVCDNIEPRLGGTQPPILDSIEARPECTIDLIKEVYKWHQQLAEYGISLRKFDEVFLKEHELKEGHALQWKSQKNQNEKPSSTMIHALVKATIKQQAPLHDSNRVNMYKHFEYEYVAKDTTEVIRGIEEDQAKPPRQATTHLSLKTAT